MNTENATWVFRREYTPDLLGRKNNAEMLDPRIGALLGKEGLPMKRETGAFHGCANSYDVYDLVGNVHEIVADTHIANNFPKERVIFVGSHYARSAAQSCAEATKDHLCHILITALDSDAARMWNDWRVPVTTRLGLGRILST